MESEPCKQRNTAQTPAALYLSPKSSPPLELVNRPAVDTAAAAHYLNRRPQTLRGWACMENGPLRPRRIMGRLAWSVAEIRAVLGVA